MNKTLDYYTALPYTIELQYDPEDAWFVRVKELPGCMSQGDSPEEAIEMIQEAMQLWLEVALEDGDPVPEPRQLEDYSGKFVVRLPRSLHRDLVDTAEEEGVSLNQYINVALGRSVGQPLWAKVENPEDTCWSMLKDGVRRALSAAGLDDEAGELDEQLFASHVANLLAQVEAALQGGYYRDGKWALEALASALYPAVQKSPVLAVFHRTACLLRDQIEPIARKHQGVPDESALRLRITQAVEGTTFARLAVREALARYSEFSEEPSLAEIEPSQDPALEHWDKLFPGPSSLSKPQGEKRRA